MPIATIQFPTIHFHYLFFAIRTLLSFVVYVQAFALFCLLFAQPPAFFRSMSQKLSWGIIGLGLARIVGFAMEWLYEWWSGISYETWHFNYSNWVSYYFSVFLWATVVSLPLLLLIKTIRQRDGYALAVVLLIALL